MQPLMQPMPIMLRCQFLCYVLKTLFFIKIALKLSYFCKKMQNFRALEAPPPDPKISSPRLRISGYAPGFIFGEDLFLIFTWIRGKKVFHFWWRPFFCSSLKSLTWKKPWSRFILPNVENRVKLQIIPPNAPQRFAPLPTGTFCG